MAMSGLGGRGCGRCLARLLVLVGLGLVSALAVRDAWLPAVGRLLERDDAPQPDAPFLVVLQGGLDERVSAAAAAYLGGRARKIIVARTEDSLPVRLGLAENESVTCVRVLRALGVPAAAILKPWTRKVTSTREESEVLAETLLAQEPRPARVILMTGWTHSRRAARVLERILAGSGIVVESLPARPAEFTVDDWWHSEKGLLSVFEEYVKLALYFWRGQL